MDIVDSIYARETHSCSNDLKQLSNVLAAIYTAKIAHTLAAGDLYLLCIYRRFTYRFQIKAMFLLSLSPSLSAVDFYRWHIAGIVLKGNSCLYCVQYNVRWREIGKIAINLTIVYETFIGACARLYLFSPPPIFIFRRCGQLAK